MYTVKASGFSTSNVNELFAYVEFCKEHRDHVRQVCERERVPNACERILRLAFERGDNAIAWTLDTELEKLRSPERRAELEREWNEVA
jgi:hypothetical protein